MAWIVTDSEHLGGTPRVRDTRISVSRLLELLATGMSMEEIVQNYPTLSQEAIKGVLTELAQSEHLSAA